MLKVGGSLQLGSGRGAALQVVTDQAAVARRLLQLVRSLFDWPTEVLVRRNRRLHKGNRYLVRILLPGWEEATLRSLGVLKGRSVAEGIRASLRKKHCCRRAYLRGAWLAGGSVTRPESAYHLEMMTPDPVFAEDLVLMLQGMNLAARVYQRRQVPVVYLKEAESVIELLSALGASQTLLHLQDVRVMKEMRGVVNRLVNCDTANLDKTVRAGLRQAEGIRLIEQRIGLERLPPALAEAAQLRLEYPEASLGELTGLLGGRVSRSGVNHRLRRLEMLAEQLAAEGDIGSGRMTDYAAWSQNGTNPKTDDHPPAPAVDPGAADVGARPPGLPAANGGGESGAGIEGESGGSRPSGADGGGGGFRQ